MKIFVVGIVLIFAYLANAAWVKVSYSVVDESNSPIRNAIVLTTTERDAVNMSWLATIKKKQIRKNTDENGNAICRFICHSGDFNVYVEAKGYYPERIINQRFDIEQDGIDIDHYAFKSKEKKIKIVLRAIRSPVKMVEIPASKCWEIPNDIGCFEFDLERGDWLPPRGSGRIADVAVCNNAITNEGVYFLRGDFRFVNGGAYVAEKKHSSSFVSVYVANTNGMFSKIFPFEYRVSTMLGAKNEYNTPINENEYLVFRVREKYDSAGRMISAHYGKIYGPIRTSGYLIFGHAFFNVTANDANLEELR